MSRLTSLALMLLLPVAAACGGSDSGADPDALNLEVGNAGTKMDATKDGMTAFIQTREYEQWIKEPEIHPSTGPHGRVRSYFNDRYAQAWRSSTFPMQVGSMSVKELYKSNGDLDGWAVAVKTKAGAEPETWTWWEAFVSELPEVKFFGVANPTCEGCHARGAANDRSLTPVP